MSLEGNQWASILLSNIITARTRTFFFERCLRVHFAGKFVCLISCICPISLFSCHNAGCCVLFAVDRVGVQKTSRLLFCPGHQCGHITCQIRTDRKVCSFFFFVRIADVFCLARTMNKRTRAKETKNKYAELHRLIRPHVDSFNYFLDEGLQQAVADLDPVEVTSSDGKSLTCILLMPVLYILT